VVARERGFPLAPVAVVVVRERKAWAVAGRADVVPHDEMNDAARQGFGSASGRLGRDHGIAFGQRPARASPSPRSRPSSAS
jgi:hypothetical protein